MTTATAPTATTTEFIPTAELLARKETCPNCQERCGWLYGGVCLGCSLEFEERAEAQVEQFESREEQEGNAPLETESPALCDYCGGELGDLDTTEDFTYLQCNDDACLPCLRDLAASHEHGQYAGCR